MKVGDKTEKTPTINNDLNPVWEKDNYFHFPVTPDINMLELKVMNSNYIKDA